MTTTEAPSRRAPLKERIRWARENPRTNGGAKISQERFADLIGTSRRHVMRIEGGYSTPRSGLIARIAEATGHGEDYFSDEDEEEDSAVAGHHSDLAVALEREVRRTVRREVRLAVSRSLSGLHTAEPTASLAKATVGSDNKGA